MKKVLILGSAPDAVRAADFDDNIFDTIVAINNSWKINANWDHSIFPTDFPVNRRPKGNAFQTLHSADEYVEIQNSYGGFLYAGGTMAFTAAYWALSYLKPDIIAFLGCDMIFTVKEQRTLCERIHRFDPLKQKQTDLSILQAKKIAQL